MARAIFLLPAWSSFGRQGLSPELAKAFGRADAPAPGHSGGDAQLMRHFTATPAQWAPAAITRQADVGDAAGAAWLRADPAHVRPEMTGARLLGIGERLSLSQDDVDALLPALKPVFGDSGFALDAPTPARWYLRLLREAKFPAFSTPDEALGEDLFEHQPEGPEGRRWRALLNEVQIVLHNHPWNARRAERGLVPINALWVWGGGVLPDRIAADATHVHCDDDLLQALIGLAGGTAQPLPQDFGSASSNRSGIALHDLRRYRDFAVLQRDWLLPALRALRVDGLASLVLDAADGTQLKLARSQRWRFWRGVWAMPAPSRPQAADPT
ncbi:MAG: phosphoglycerate mutase [Lysobacter sp.]|nr:phosphoglycerate mutase [Lysobacter sp.]